MTPKVVKVMPRENFNLLLTFDNDEQRVFDVAPYFNKGFFKELGNFNYFRWASLFSGASAGSMNKISAPTRSTWKVGLLRTRSRLDSVAFTSKSGIFEFGDRFTQVQR